MSTRKLNLIVLICGVVLTAGFVFGLLAPGIRESRRRQVSLHEKLREVAAEQQQVGNVSELYASIVELDEKLRGHRRRLPTERQFGAFLSSLSDTLKSVGVDQYVVQPRPEQQLDEARLPDRLKILRGIMILPVRVSFEGTFSQVFDFLKAVEELPRLSQLESMKLVNDQTGAGRLRAEILLHSYHRPAGRDTATDL